MTMKTVRKGGIVGAVKREWVRFAIANLVSEGEPVCHFICIPFRCWAQRQWADSVISVATFLAIIWTGQ